ncbi:DUF1638 domain-containing protein [Albimonas sp. CAU 1670]|uniref:DUF1638 domain-containing protein n=1 Tax=Albimonas sp. CAU 1670 TaxID=3032599 RepID=UPI0023DB1391|nr:DUF1638 domain-containing protein [Albimonas sp. CAU 1670]MDF2232654.1 DUF1638 domain-containing protein [Albimonas sp. CAU 1670]
MTETTPAPLPEPDDETLTREGLSVPAEAPGPGLGPDLGRVRLIACGALAREILALIRLNGWSHLDLKCLPAQLHLRPDLIPDAVAREVERARGRFDAVKVVYADCGTGGLLEKRCAELGVEMIPGPHCYSFFDGNETFAARGDAEMTCFYLTDFLVRQFDAFVWKPMGLDRHPELRDMIFGHYTTLVHLAQIEDAELDAKAQEAAARLGLAHQRRFTGYGDLAGFLANAGARAGG